MQLEPTRTLTGRMQRRKRRCSRRKGRGNATRSECSRKKQINAFTLEHPAAERGGDRAPLPESQSKRRVDYLIVYHIELGSYQNTMLGYIEYAFIGSILARTPVTPGSPGSMATIRRLDDRPHEHYM